LENFITILHIDSRNVNIYVFFSKINSSSIFIHLHQNDEDQNNEDQNDEDNKLFCICKTLNDPDRAMIGCDNSKNRMVPP